MPDIHERVGDDSDSEHHVCEFIFLRARKPAQQRAKENHHERQHAFDEYRCPKASHNGLHQRIRLHKKAARKQYSRTQPVGQIEYIQKRQPVIKGKASACCGTLLFLNSIDSHTITFLFLVII